MRTDYDQTGRFFPGMHNDSEAAYRFLYCDANNRSSYRNHTPEALPDMRAAGRDQQHCQHCGLPLITRIVGSTLRFGRFPLTVIEWP